MRMEFLWLALIVVFAVIEGATTALTTVWFIGGALAALAAALLHAELWLQITLFFAVSVVLLAALRPLVKKYLRPRTVRTNAAGNIGREAIVTGPSTICMRPARSVCPAWNGRPAAPTAAPLRSGPSYGSTPSRASS